MTRTMAYDPQVVQAARLRLEQRRTDATTRAADLRQRLCAQIPRLAEIEREKAEALPEITRVILAGGNPQALEQAKAKNLRLQEEMAAILHRAGYEGDNFEPQYTCAVCSDTGYVGGRICDCYRQLLKEEACKRLSGLSNLRLTDFDTMDMSLYDTLPDPKWGVSPRQQMEDIIHYCQAYATHFTPSADSLLLQGATGTGKTHLSLAIAKAVTEKGFGVVYGSVQPLLRRLEDEQFGRVEGDSLQQLAHCDLLVLDDLGMEFDTPLGRSAIYNLINARLLEGKPTIISTNLSFSALQERYGDQIASRINGGFQPLLCLGKDIRQLLRQRAMG